jgi:hypothetical protein
LVFGFWMGGSGRLTSDQRSRRQLAGEGRELCYEAAPSMKFPPTGAAGHGELTQGVFSRRGAS